MTIALTVAVCVLAALMFVLLGAQVELFDQVKQLRRFLDLEDRVTVLELGAALGARPSGVGLPAELDDADRALILLLSNKCATCQTIAATLRGGQLPPSTWLVVVPVTGDGTDFVEAYDLHGERIIVDRDGRIVDGLGVEVTPAGIIVEHGRLAGAQTVPSVRHLRAVQPSGKNRVPTPVRGES
jgi:hypothetical protein